MSVVLIKPDALTGPNATTRTSHARGLLHGLAHHLEPTPAPAESHELIDRAARHVAERASTEPAFRARPVRAIAVARHLQAEAANLVLGRTIPTSQLIVRSLSCLGFSTIRHADHVLGIDDLQEIYPELMTSSQDGIRPQLVDYLVGNPVRVLWLAGDQHPGVLQVWKTYLRHAALPRSDGEYLLRNLVHVCDQRDADYLTNLLAQTPAQPTKEGPR